MPRNPSSRETRRVPFELRREAAVSVALPVFAAASAAAVIWQYMFLADPPPAWAPVVNVVGWTVLASAVAAAITLCFTGRARRYWKIATVVPAAIIGGAIAVYPALQELALVDHGVNAECTVVAKQDYFETVDEETEAKTNHDFACAGWDAVSLETYSDEQLDIGEVKVVVFDPLGRADPDFGDPSVLRAALFGLLAAVLFAGAAFGRLLIVDDGTVRTAVGGAFARLYRRVFGQASG